MNRVRRFSGVFALRVVLCIGLCSPFLHAISAHAQTQGISNLGTDFWFGFMPNYTIPADNIRIYVACETATHVVVEMYGGGNGTPSQGLTYSLAPGQAQTITLPVGKVETRTTETPSYRAIHVFSTNPIACYGFSNEYASSDGFLALPTHALGTEYYTMNYNDDWYDSSAHPLAGEFMIVAPFDSTTVVLRTASDTRLDSLGQKIGHQFGAIWAIELMKGETYLVQSTGISKANDITGSHITSDKPIALLSGHQGCSIPNNDPTHTSKNHLIEMIPPLNEWGTEAFAMPVIGRTKCGDYDRVLSGANNNMIQVNGGNTEFYLNAGEYVENNYVLQPTVYRSINGKPFLLEMYAYSQNVYGDPIAIDPFMSTMPPLEQLGKRIVFRTPKNPGSNGDYTHYITFVGRWDSIMSIQLNGKSIKSWGAPSPDSFPGTSPVMGATRLQLSAGEVTFTASSGSPFGAFLYGFTQLDGYGWPAAMGVALQNIQDSIAPIFHSIADDCTTYSDAVHDSGAGIAVVAMITDTLDFRWPKHSYNAFFTPEQFMSGDKEVRYSVSVIDPNLPAYAAIYAVDRVGNAVIHEYSYSGASDSIASLQDPLAPKIDLGQDSCTTLSFKNIAAADQLIDSIFVLGPAAPGIFTLDSLNFPIQLLPGDTLSAQVCIRPADIGVFIDTLIVEYHCGRKAVVLTAQGVTGLLNVADLNFGSVDSGTVRCLPLELHNSGNGPLTILGWQNDPNSEFSIDTTLHVPFKIPPGDSQEISVCYHPMGSRRSTTTLHFLTANVPKYLHSLRDSSVLTGTSNGLGVYAPSPTGAKQSGITILDLSPNPSSGTILVQYDLQHSTRSFSAAVYDERGVLEETVAQLEPRSYGHYTLSLDESKLPEGSYFLRLETPEGRATRKFIIER